MDNEMVPLMEVQTVTPKEIQKGYLMAASMEFQMDFLKAQLTGVQMVPWMVIQMDNEMVPTMEVQTVI
jgi:hypothetical protein